MPYTLYERPLFYGCHWAPPLEGAPATMEEREALPVDSPYKGGPGIEELPAAVRDALAGIPGSRLDERVERRRRS